MAKEKDRFYLFNPEEKEALRVLITNHLNTISEISLHKNFRRCRMRLEDIGFYTLDDDRAKNTSVNSPLWRCELILTDRCNFKCPYCRGLQGNNEQSYESAKRVVDLWCDESLQNIRFSGGEPTTWKHLLKLVAHTKNRGVKRIAISTNGSRDYNYYKELVGVGVNDFSISLDACCASTGDMMTGGIKGAWNKVIDNIKKLSEITYVTVGVVLTPENIQDVDKTICFAYGLGVSDIRIISSAQWDDVKHLRFITVSREILNKCRILNYRISHFKYNRNVRGLTEHDNNRCPLVLDDMVVKGDKHYPCVIHMREGGSPIGMVGKNMREERLRYYSEHNTHSDPICKKNCLDVCIDYNNKVRKTWRVQDELF